MARWGITRIPMGTCRYERSKCALAGAVGTALGSTCPPCVASRYQDDLAYRLLLLDTRVGFGRVGQRHRFDRQINRA
jgi:hypothetical protein